MSHRLRRKPRRSLLVIAVAVLALCGIGVGIGVGMNGSHRDGPPSAAQRADFADVLPAPVSATATGGQFTITAATSIHAPSGSAPALAVAGYLAARLRPATGFALPVTSADAGGAGAIRLVLSGGDKQLGAEGYRLDVSDDQITATAAQPAGLFHAVQTLRQLLPPQSAEHTAQPGLTWTVPNGHVLDYPRFAYRAAGLDVARH